MATRLTTYTTFLITSVLRHPSYKGLHRADPATEGEEYWWISTRADSAHQGRDFDHDTLEGACRAFLDYIER